MQNSECKILENKKDVEILSLSLLSKLPELRLQNLTIVFSLMYFSVLLSRCEKCSIKALDRLDFTDVADKLSKNALNFINSCLIFEDDEN